MIIHRLPNHEMNQEQIFIEIEGVLLSLKREHEKKGTSKNKRESRSENSRGGWDESEATLPELDLMDRVSERECKTHGPLGKGTGWSAPAFLEFHLRRAVW